MSAQIHDKSRPLSRVGPEPTSVDRKDDGTPSREYWELPLEEAYLEAFLSDVFENYWQGLCFGPLVQGAAYELRCISAPTRISLRDGYLTIMFGHGGHFHLCIGENKGSERFPVSAELRAHRRPSMARIFRGYGRDGKPVTWGFEMANGKNEPMISIFFPNPFINEDDSLSDEPQWARLETWRAIAKTWLGREPEDIDSAGAGFRRASVIDAADATMTRAIRGAERPSSGASGGVMRVITLGGGILLSLLFHGSVLATFLYLTKQKPGAIEQPTEAISVASLQSDVLEAVSAAQSAAAVSASSVDETVGEIKESAAAQPSQAREFEPDEPHTVPAATEVRNSAVQPEGLDLVRGELVSERSAGDETGAADVTAEAGAHERNVREQSASRKPRTPAQALLNHDRSSQRKQKGAASVRSKSGAQASAGRVSASSGSALNYAALVRARVAGRRPGGNGGRGTVVVAFSVSRAGALNSARIARSSGNSSLDSSVLAAVRGAGPFPPPPATANLSFSMPFYFK